MILVKVSLKLVQRKLKFQNTSHQYFKECWKLQWYNYIKNLFCGKLWNVHYNEKIPRATEQKTLLHTFRQETFEYSKNSHFQNSKLYIEHADEFLIAPRMKF